ncbi:thiamine pyrophosphate-binding protein [Paraburkholderia fungorum]
MDIKCVFGLVGVYALWIEGALYADNTMRWIGGCHEFNAAYPANGYARIHGIAALRFTCGFGELSGIAGAYTEYLRVFDLVGMRASGVHAARPLAQHTLSNGEFDIFRDMFTPAVCAHSITTLES